MPITILYFASLRETLNRSREAVDPPATVRTVGDLRAWLAARGPDEARALAAGRAVRMAVDQTLATADTPLAPGAEVAFFPPVTGG